MPTVTTDPDLDTLLDAAQALVAAVNAVSGPVLALVGAALPGAHGQATTVLLAMNELGTAMDGVLALVGQLDG